MSFLLQKRGKIADVLSKLVLVVIKRLACFNAGKHHCGAPISVSRRCHNHPLSPSGVLWDCYSIVDGAGLMEGSHSGAPLVGDP